MKYQENIKPFIETINSEVKENNLQTTDTPYELTEEMVNVIEDINNKKILVLFNLEFIYTLIYKFNVDPSKIWFTSDNNQKNISACKIFKVNSFEYSNINTLTTKKQSASDMSKMIINNGSELISEIFITKAGKTSALGNKLITNGIDTMTKLINTDNKTLTNINGIGEKKIVQIDEYKTNYKKSSDPLTSGNIDKEEENNKMKFDVIIGNPPYQDMDNGNGASAKPLYHNFIEKAIELKPEQIVFITPSRWMVGGKGLDNFRKSFKSDTRLKFIKHYTNSQDIFPTVDIKGGVSYFLWDNNYDGDCEFKVNEEDSFMNNLDDYDVIITDKFKKDILDKVYKIKTNDLLTKLNYWNLETNHFSKNTYSNNLISCYCNNKTINKMDDSLLDDKDNILNSYNVIIPNAMGDGFKKGLYNLLEGKMKIVKDSCWTRTYVVLKSFDNKKEAENFIKYMESRTVLLLLSIMTNTQHFSSKVYKILEDFSNYGDVYDDEYLYKHYGLSQDEIDYIEESVEVK